MKNRILSSILLSAILVISLSLVSAVDLVQVTKGNDLTRNLNTSTFAIQNVYGSNINFSMAYPALQVSDGKGHLATLTLSPTSLALNNFLNGNQSTVNVSLAVGSNFLVNPVTYQFPAITLNAVDSANPLVTDSKNVTFSFTQTYCKYGDIGDIDITKLTDNKLDNKDEWIWHPSDNIQITTRVRNSVGEDLDFLVDYGLYDITDNSFIDIGEDSISLSVNDGSSKETTISFQVPSDINADHEYKFYVKAYEDGNEKTICQELTPDTNVQINQEANSVILSNIQAPSTATCGDSIDLTAKAINNGNNDQDKVLVTAYNKELGLNLTKVFDSFSSGDESNIDFSYTLPSNLTEKTYTITYMTFFRYDENNAGCNSVDDTACYDRNSFDDLSKTYTSSLQVTGCQPVVVQPTTNAQITAVLNSAANAGGEIIVKATVRNTGSTANTYLIVPSGIDSFATLEKVDPQTITLAAGNSQDVLIYLKANSAASGDYTFNVQAISGSTVNTQSVSLTVQPSSSAFSGFGNLGSSLSKNWFIWLIVLINVVLIVLIIIVAVRIARR